jgi:hypothetical protein
MDKRELARFIKKSKPEKIADIMSDLINHVFELDDYIAQGNSQYARDDYADYYSFNDSRIDERASLLKAPIEKNLELDLETDYSG